MTRWVIVDTGPLVAYFDRRDARHAWAKRAFKEFRGPLLSVEPVITEALFLLCGRPDAQDKVLEKISQRIIQLPFQLGEDCEAIRQLRRKYADQPMALADACLVRLAEIYDRHSVCTFDGHFLNYRKHGREPIPLIAPPKK